MFIFTAVEYSIIGHNFIHSTVDGHLACFQFLAILINAATNVHAHISFSYFHRSRIIGHQYMHMSSLNDTAEKFSKLCQFKLLSAVYEWSQPLYFRKQSVKLDSM